VYDFLAGVSKKERRKVLSKEEVLTYEPLLKDTDLVGGVSYYEYRTDDARLTLAIALEAQKRGVDFFTYALCEELIYDNKQVKGVVVKDQRSGEKVVMKAKVVVNAAGPWVDAIDAKDYSAEKDKLFLTKGVHIVFNHSKFPIKQAMYFDVEDKRMIFAIPREHCTYVGTTDTAFNKELDSVSTLNEDAEYLLKSINKLFPDLHLSKTDIIGSWAGLRPLIRQKKKSPSAISRKDELFINKSGLITIAGGKLTGYRKMAERTVDVVCAKLNLNKSCVTHNLQLHGSDYVANVKWNEFLELKTNELVTLNIPSDEAKRLVTLLGSKIEIYIKLFQTFVETTPMQLPKYYRVLMLYTVKYEMARTLEDVLVRRTSDWYFRHAFVKQHENEILTYAEELFHWHSEDRLNAMRFLNTPIIDPGNL
jgi:glycerol-3-phosphate dehydrogenase